MTTRRQLSANNASSTLASDISSFDEVLTLRDASKFPTPGINEFFVVTIDNGVSTEIVEVTSRSGNTLAGLTRAREGTNASYFASGSKVEVRVTAEWIKSVEDLKQDLANASTDSPSLNNVSRVVFSDVPGPVTSRGLSWNISEQTLDLGLGGTSVVLQIGQETLYRSRNNTGQALISGTVVMAAGTLGNSGRILITPAIANGTYDGKYIMGVVTEDIPNGADGFVTHFGKVRGVPTNGADVGEAWADGDILYAHPSLPGRLTKNRPTIDNQIVTVAIVLNAHPTNGTLVVRPTIDSVDASVVRYHAAGGQSKTVQAAIDEVSGGVSAVALASSTGSSLVGYHSGTVLEELDLLTGPSGAASVGYTPAGTGAVATSVQAKLRESKTLSDYGGVADYTGTPLYDGADAGRVTATDNTVAFQNLVNAAIAAGQDSVRIPAGHWGIKTGNLSFTGFDRLRIHGDGIGVTILDFIKEDTTHTGGVVVTNAQANAIATFTTGNGLEFQDMTVKATTKGGLVNGAPGSNRVYEGAVFGFKINNVAEVRFTRVRAERFNYKGFSVYGTSTNRVVITHCEGFYNVGSGFWVDDAATVRVTGGEFAYNGVFGETGTGYGVTASSNVGKFVVKAPYCHHNYRKGIDSHGCAEFIVKGGTFENNVLFHTACVNNAPPASAAECIVIIKSNTFSNGRLAADKAWLKTCYDQLATNGYTAANAAGMVFSVQDTNGAGTALDKIKNVIIEENDVICHYNGIGDTALANNDAFISVRTRVAKVSFKGNTLNFENAQLYAGGNVYNHIAITMIADDLTVAGNDIKFTQATTYTNVTSGLTDYGVLFELKANDLRVEFFNNRFALNDIYFTTTTNAGIRAAVAWTVAGSKRAAKDNVWTFVSDRFTGFNSLNDPYFLGNNSSSNVPLQQSGNVFVRGTVLYKVQECPLDRTHNSVGFRLPGVNKTAGQDVFYIVLDKQFGTTIRVVTDDGSSDLAIRVAYSSYTGITGSTGNTYFSYSSVDPNFVEDGLTKLKITVKAKINLSGDYWGRILVDGVNPSFGVEKVVML